EGGEDYNQQMRNEIEQIDREDNANWQNEEAIGVWYHEADELDERKRTSFHWEGVIKFEFPARNLLVKPNDWEDVYEKITKPMNQYSNEYRIENASINVSHDIATIALDFSGWGVPDEYREFIQK